jgi:hypothetical protein
LACNNRLIEYAPNRPGADRATLGNDRGKFGDAYEVPAKTLFFRGSGAIVLVAMFAAPLKVIVF